MISKLMSETQSIAIDLTLQGVLTPVYVAKVSQVWPFPLLGLEQGICSYFHGHNANIYKCDNLSM